MLSYESSNRPCEQLFAPVVKQVSSNVPAHGTTAELIYHITFAW